MTTHNRFGFSFLMAGAFLTATAVVSGQTFDFLINRQTASPEPVVTGAPYSAEGITTLKLILFDGTRIERTVTAKLFRDRAGRIRREQTVVGLDPLKPASDGSMSVVTIVDPVAKMIYTLNPGSRTAHRLAMPNLADAQVAIPPGMPAPPPRREEALGTRQIEGLDCTGRRTTMTIPAGQIGNDRPIEVTDEEWQSTELKVLVLSMHHNPQTGDVQYRLTNIRRGEQPVDLFVVPAGYTILESVPGPPR